MSKLQIRLFGQVEISYAAGLPPLKLTRAAQELLAYLLLDTGHMCRREVLMDVFWPDHSAERARSCLNSAVYRLRRELQTAGAPDTTYVLTSDSGEIGFNWECDYWLDVQSFQRGLLQPLRKPASEIGAGEAGQMEQALGLYRGDLLEGIYDDWTLIERERLRTTYMNGLVQLMNYHATCGAYAKSLEFGQAILEKDPLREDVHRKMMRNYLLAGQRALAVKQYQICAVILNSELGISPMDETEQLYREIVDASGVQPSSPVHTTPERDNLTDHFQSVMHNLEQAHTHLKQAARLMARLMPATVKAYGEKSSNDTP